MVCLVFQYDREFKEFRLHSIMSEHKKTITAISWNPKDTDLLASASADNQVRAYSHQAKDGSESEKGQRTNKKYQRINGKHQRKFSLSRSFSFGLNTA